MKDVQLSTFNDFLRRYGRLEVRSGQFSVYSQSAVRNGQVSGYVKPLFTNLQFRKSEQDKRKPGLRKVYQGAVNGAAKLLRRMHFVLVRRTKRCAKKKSIGSSNFKSHGAESIT